MSEIDRPLRRAPRLNNCYSCEYWRRRQLDQNWGRCERLDMDTFVRGAGCVTGYKAIWGVRE